MPFSSTRTIAADNAEIACNPDLQLNTRVLNIGVTSYKNFSDQPVTGALSSALSWMVVAMRLGVVPNSTGPVVDGYTDIHDLQARFLEVIASSDTSEAERKRLLDAANGLDSGPSSWLPDQPTYASILTRLFYEGGALEWYKESRLLITYSGHGVLVRGRPVLCPSDTVTKPVPRTPERLQKLFDTRVAALNKAAIELQKQPSTAKTPEDQAYLALDLAAYAEIVKVLNEMWTIAAKKGVQDELIDVVWAPLVGISEGLSFYAPDTILTAMRFVQRNLSRIPKQNIRRPAEYGNVITHIHLMLMLGEYDRRVTLVLDACHSGGLGDGLQGSMEGHAWTAAGLRCRIFSASDSGQVAAETRIGGRSQSVATWALTQVLSRWNRVQDGNAYAISIRNGELVYRANLLLMALGFRQQISLHSGAPEAGAPLASNLPFFGLLASTLTVSDPEADSDAIQISSDTNSLTLWQFKEPAHNGNNAILRAALLAVGSGVSNWTYTPPPSPGYAARTYNTNQLYVFAKNGDIDSLIDYLSANSANTFTVEMTTWNLQGDPPDAFKQVLNSTLYQNKPLCWMPATNDPGEHAYSGSDAISGVFKYCKPSGSNTVYFRWIKAAGGNPQRLYILKSGSFPFVPGDFGDGAMSFSAAQSSGYGSGFVERVVDLVQQS